MSEERRTVVLVHGGFVDGAGWESAYNILRRNGYNVAIVQDPTISLADDDKMIPPQAQRIMAQRAGATVVETSGSHAIYVSRPEVVAEVIEKAAGLARSQTAG